MGSRFALSAPLAALVLTLAAWGGVPGLPAVPAHASQRTTSLISVALDGGFPNGPSRNPAVSHDQRTARYIAYESDASNIVPSDNNGETDIFLVSRAAPFGENGTPWKPGGTQLISSGLNGALADGPSYRPVIDGDAHHPPRCVAFLSEASNLVPGDTNEKPDGFVYDIPSKKITRVTVDSSGAQSNGTTFDISISGHCKRVAFTSDATNLAPAGPAKVLARVRSSEAAPGTRQVYVHMVGGAGANAGFTGLTFRVSTANNGDAGNGSSWEPNIARAGKAVVFSSNATNLAAGDRRRMTDVYRRTIIRKFQHLGNGKGVQTLQGSISLVSATRSGKAGNGPSTHPTVTDDGRYVAFQTDASNLLPGDSNGTTDVARAQTGTRRPGLSWVSKTRADGIGNGPSRHPVISDAGLFVLFDSQATNLRASASHHVDPNGKVSDVFLWNAPTGNVSLESRDSVNGYLSSASQHPGTSSRGNYVAFESANPLIDLPLAEQLYPALVQTPSALDPALLPALSDPDVLAPDLQRPATSAGFSRPAESASIEEAAAAAANAGQQIYLRYLGPK
jgi:hypothetical protein